MRGLLSGNLSGTLPPRTRPTLLRLQGERECRTEHIIQYTAVHARTSLLRLQASRSRWSSRPTLFRLEGEREYTTEHIIQYTAVHARTSVLRLQASRSRWSSCARPLRPSWMDRHHIVDRIGTFSPCVLDSLRATLQTRGDDFSAQVRR